MVERIFVFVLIMCILNILRETFRFSMCFAKNEKYESGITRTLFLWASIAYIITIIFYGF